MDADPPKTNNKHNNRYPWADWLAAPLPLCLEPGIHFPSDVKSESIAWMLRQKAKEAGLVRGIRVGPSREVVMTEGYLRLQPKRGKKRGRKRAAK